jgi:hypothetical protein
MGELVDATSKRSALSFAMSNYGLHMLRVTEAKQAMGTLLNQAVTDLFKQRLGNIAVNNTDSLPFQFP